MLKGVKFNNYYYNIINDYIFINVYNKNMDIESKLGTIIGKGGFGSVYTIIDMPKLCVKKSNKNNNCRIWKNEYNIIINIHKILNKIDIFNKLKYIKIIKAIQFIENSNGNCYMIMNRIYRPIIPITKTNITKLNNLTINALFGIKKNTLYKKSQRGEFYGLDKLNDIFNEEQIKVIIKELGIVMALLHFIVKIDAFDIELYVGLEYDNITPCIYIADFDLSENIIDFNDDIIKNRICWALEAMPYFPNKDCNEEHYNIFKEAYIKIAKNDEITDKIFTCYI